MSDQRDQVEERPVEKDEGVCTLDNQRAVSPGPAGSGELYYDVSEEEEEVPVELGRAIAAHLERLSVSGSNLNALEVQILQSRREYEHVKADSIKLLQALKSKLQTHISKTEPFVTVWQNARKIQENGHQAATRYERAQSEYESAKETLRIAERGLADLKENQVAKEEVDRRSSNACKLDQAWQETLANATLRVVKAEKERVVSEREHRELTQQYQQVQEEHRLLEKKLKKSIERSKPYYETRYRCNLKLQNIKQRIVELEEKVKKNKMEYRFTMSRLESVSEGIHARRRSHSMLSPAVSEPSLVDRFGSMVLSNLPPKAATPDLKRKENGLRHCNSLKPLFKGGSGSLPTVQASTITAQPSSRQTDQSIARHVVTNCLSHALTRYKEEEMERETNDEPTDTLSS